MPISAHYGGHGKRVLKAMTKTYGAKKAKSVFYGHEANMKKQQKVRHAATGGTA